MNKNAGKILIVDDDEDVLIAARLLLKQHFTIVRTEKDPQNIPALLKNDSYDVIMLDMNFTKDVTSGKEGFYWLNTILEIAPSAVVILITAFGDVEMAVKAVKEGATDFVLKPWQNEKLLATLSSAMKLKKSQDEIEKLRSYQKTVSTDQDTEFQEFIGSSPAMLSVFEKIEKVAKTDANVLILGENGTGKELVARAIHRHSPRSGEVFVSVDMGAISETLFESELFGHVKGAFTDAKEDRAGRFEIANGGTLFLDEIGNLPIVLQSKLLTVLSQRVVTRVGSNKQTPFDIRLICATNMPLYDMITRSQFRQDLLYRINTIEIHLPPLRERAEDIPLIADHYLDIYTKKYKKPRMRLSPLTVKKLQKYHWPGNVRELQHAIERAVIMADSPILEPGEFILSAKEVQEAEGLQLEKLDLETIEKLVVQKALAKHEGNVSQAAQELGLTRTSLYRRMEKYGL